MVEIIILILVFLGVIIVDSHLNKIRKQNSEIIELLKEIRQEKSDVKRDDY